MTAFHFHVCENCFAVLAHKPMSPEPCNYHDCRKCGEEVDRLGFGSYREASEEAARLKKIALTSITTLEG